MKKLFYTEATVSIGLKRIQSGNIHTIVLDVNAVKQSALKLSFQFSQRKLDKNVMLSLLLPENLSVVKTHIHVITENRIGALVVLFILHHHRYIINEVIIP